MNGSYVPPFSISVSSPSIQVAPGGSAQTSSTSQGTRSAENISLQFSDNEFNNGTAKLPHFTQGLSTANSRRREAASIAIDLISAAASGIQPGTYLAAATVTDGSIYRSVYFTVIVT